MTPARHNTAWSDKEDRDLTDGWLFGGRSIANLASKHQRTMGAIASRLHKLELITEHPGVRNYSGNESAMSLCKITDSVVVPLQTEEDPTMDKLANQILNLKFEGKYVRIHSGEIYKVPAPARIGKGQYLITDGPISARVEEVFDHCPDEALQQRVPFIMENGVPELLEMRQEQEEKARKILTQAITEQTHAKMLAETEALFGKSTLDEAAEELNSLSIEALLSKALKGALK